MKLPYDINRDESLDQALADKLVESAQLAIRHFAPGAGVHGVAVHCQRSTEGKSAGTDKFRVNLIVEGRDGWKLITLFGNAKYIDLKLRDQKGDTGKAYDYDRSTTASGELDAEFQLTRQIKAAESAAAEKGQEPIRFMAAISADVASELGLGTAPKKRETEVATSMASFAAKLAPPVSAFSEPVPAKAATPFGDW